MTLAPFLKSDASVAIPSGAASGYVLTSDASGFFSWQPADVSGSGTSGRLTKWTGTDSIGDSPFAIAASSLDLASYDLANCAKVYLTSQSSDPATGSGEGVLYTKNGGTELWFRAASNGSTTQIV